MTTVTGIKPIDFNDTAAISKEINNFAEKYAYADVEHALEISPNGNIYSLRGTKGYVSFEIIGENALKGSISIHNHPVEIGKIKGDSFSLKDLTFTAENMKGKQYLISGERRNAFEFIQNYTENDLYNSWKKAYTELLKQASIGQTNIIYEQEQILKILNDLLKGFKFYENF